MGIKDWFRGRKKPEGESRDAGRAPAQQEKIERMNALFTIGCSIQKWSFKAAGPYLAARHGYDKHISPRILYFDADQAFLDARKLAKEIGDKRKEAEILYNWALLQWHPPAKGISFVSGSASEKLQKTMAYVQSLENMPEGMKASPEETPYESVPELALQFFLEAFPLAEETGHDLVATASLLYSAQIDKARGDAEKYQAQREKLRQKIIRISRAKTPLPQWLLNEIKEEVGL
jgi:hypothetical protein